jgi:hypothetical protein
MATSAHFWWMEDIRNWFNTKKNYSDGVKLYLKYGKDPILIRLFTQEEKSQFKENKLASALNEILSSSIKSAKATTIVKAIPAEKKQLQVKPEQIARNRWPDQCDEILSSLKYRWRELYGEMTNLQARLGDLARAGANDPNKRQEAARMALRILDLDEACDDIYSKKDYYVKHGNLPIETPPIEISVDPALWYKKLHNHQRYCRQFRTDLVNDPGNTDKAELLKKHEWAVSQYKKLLKMEDAVA